MFVLLYTQVDLCQLAVTERIQKLALFMFIKIWTGNFVRVLEEEHKGTRVSGQLIG